MIVSHFEKASLSYNVKKLFSKKDVNKIVSYMQKDKKNNSEKINLILLKKIGLVDLKMKFSNKQIKTFLNKALLN